MRSCNTRPVGLWQMLAFGYYAHSINYGYSVLLCAYGDSLNPHGL